MSIYTSLVLRKSNAHGASRLVLIALAEYAGHDGVACIPHAVIADLSGVYIRSVPRCLGELMALEEIEQLSSSSGRGKYSSYKILLTEGSIRDDDNPDFNEAQDVPTSLTAIRHQHRTDIEQRPDQPAPTMTGDNFKPASAAHVDYFDAGVQGVMDKPKESPIQQAPEMIKAPPQAPLSEYSRFPAHIPKNDVGRVLSALGVKESPNGLLYWHRVEHTDQLAAVMVSLGLTVDHLIVKLKGVQSPDLQRISQIPKLIR